MRKLLILSLALASCAKAPQVDYKQYSNGTVVNYHGGGTMGKVLPEIANMKAPRMVKGFCGSYCTYVLKYPDTCVSRGSGFTFHAVRWKGGIMNQQATRVLADQYPHKLRDWYLSRVFDGKDYALRGYDLIDNFNIKEC